MAGRGFLKARLAAKQLAAAKESDEKEKSQLPIPQELVKPEESSLPQDLSQSQGESSPTPKDLHKFQELAKKQEENIPKVSVSVECPPPLIAERQQPVRGRRVITIIY